MGKRSAHTDAIELLTSIQAVKGKPYLGDRKVIDGLLRQLVSGVLIRIGAVGQGELTKDDAIQADHSECVELARILQGQSPDYLPVPDWTDGELLASLQVSLFRKIDIMLPGNEFMDHVICLFIAKIYETAHRNEQDAGLMIKAVNAEIDQMSALLLGVGDYLSR